MFVFLNFDISYPELIGCTCDLTGTGCDVNCCCDTDCSTADQEAFTECKDTDVKYVLFYCSHYLSFCKWLFYL